MEQIGEDGLRHPVAYASRATNEAERKYPPTKLEMASIIFALNHFEVYLLGHKITVYTDHQALASGYIIFERPIKRIAIQMVFENLPVPSSFDD